MSACLHCKSKAACVQCTQCKSALYCNAECARSHWSDTHQYECATSPIGVKFFFEYGLPLFISSIANGTVNVYDITAQLEASPKYIPQFLDWMRNPGASDGIIRALMGPYAPDDVNQRERNQLLIAVYTIGRIEGWPSITNTMPRILPDQDVYNAIIAADFDMLLRLFKEASQDGNYYLVQYLTMLRHVNPAADDNHAIRWASHNGHLAVVKYLMTFRDLGVDPAAQNNTAIQWASENGHLTVVEYFMMFRYLGVDPAANDNYAIQMASAHGHLAVVKYVMTFDGVNPAADNNYAIRHASANGYIDVVKFLMEFRDRGVDPTTDDNFAIRYASRKGHLDVVQYLMTLDGVDPAADDNYGIRLASHNGHLPVVKYLMTFRHLGVDPAAGNNYAIRWASHQGHLPVVQYLMTFDDVDPAAENNYAIRMASIMGHLAVVKQLLTSPRVNISKQEAQDRWDVSQDDDVKLFWKAYITQLDVRETREQGMERPTKLNKERIDF